MTSLLFHFWFYLALIVALMFMSVTFFVGFFFVAKGEPLSRFAVGGVGSRHAGPNTRDDQPSELSRTQRVLSRAGRSSDRPDRILSSKNLCANQQKLGCQIFAKVGQYDFTTAEIASRDDFNESGCGKAPSANERYALRACGSGRTTGLNRTLPELRTKPQGVHTTPSGLAPGRSHPFARPGAHNLSPRDGVRQGGLLRLLLVNKQIT